VRICFIADARSPTARSWIGYFAQRSHEVHVLSTYPCAPDLIPGATIHHLGFVGYPGAFTSPPGSSGRLAARLPDPSGWLGRTISRGWESILQPARCFALAPRTKALIASLRPHLLHALRIPIEGELGYLTGFRPFLVSVWGNDFTLYAAKSFAHGFLTRRVMESVSGLIADSDADIARAKLQGVRPGCPTRTLPGGGGICRSLFYRGPCSAPVRSRLGIDAAAPLIVNPRGYRTYVRNDTFLEAIPRVLAEYPNAVFVGIGLANWKTAEHWVKVRGLERSVILTPPLKQNELADLFRASSVLVSPAEHDGTPNTLLEALACGCFPVCGDLPSIREWISSGHNGLLFDPGNSVELATAICQALGDSDWRRRAADYNALLVSEKADYNRCMESAAEFYRELMSSLAESALQGPG
jgi:glycosyltransferase involved in cell wall biosynthesis